MAIKFRCRHCGQFLGISLSRAGNVVDCPSCGRQLRVPDLDGRIRPLPSPQLDLDDSGLVRALGEVAKIGKPPSTEEMDVRAVLERVSEEIVEPVPLPEPVAVDPPLPVEMPTGPTATLVNDRENAPLPAARLHSDPFAELARLAEEEPVMRRRPVARRDHWKELREQLSSPTVLITLLISTLLALCVGILIGRATAP